MTLAGGAFVCAECEWHVFPLPRDWSIHEIPAALPCYSHWAVVSFKAFFFNRFIEKNLAAHISWSQTMPPQIILQRGVENELSLEDGGGLSLTFFP